MPQRMMPTAESVGASPELENPLSGDMRQKQQRDLTSDPGVMRVLKLLTGRDIPAEAIDDELAQVIKSLVQRMGIEGTVRFLEQNISKEDLKGIKEEPINLEELRRK